jgi:hypothetical protein
MYPIYLFSQGRGRGELTREKVRGAIVCGPLDLLQEILLAMVH